jgi:hypothetical protein
MVLRSYLQIKFEMLAQSLWTKVPCQTARFAAELWHNRNVPHLGDPLLSHHHRPLPE